MGGFGSTRPRRASADGVAAIGAAALTGVGCATRAGAGSPSIATPGVSTVVVRSSATNAGGGVRAGTGAAARAALREAGAALPAVDPADTAWWATAVARPRRRRAQAVPAARVPGAAAEVAAGTSVAAARRGVDSEVVAVPAPV